jgi:hypothetical protein
MCQLSFAPLTPGSASTFSGAASTFMVLKRTHTPTLGSPCAVFLNQSRARTGILSNERLCIPVPSSMKVARPNSTSAWRPSVADSGPEVSPSGMAKS